MKRVIVPVDFSGATEAVIGQAMRVARAFDARLVLLHVAAPDPDFVGYDAGPDSVRAQRASELRQEHRDLQERADALREGGLDAMALLVKGPTAEKILETAESQDADLIVMGSHGRGALGRAILGSVSLGVLRDARCPVMILPAQAADAR